MFHRLLSILPLLTSLRHATTVKPNRRHRRRRNKLAQQHGLWQIQALEPRVLLSASVDGRVWLDANVNGIQDPGELDLQNVAVVLLNSSDVQVGATVTTDSNGLFNFTGLNAGSYRLGFDATAVDATYKLTFQNAKFGGALLPTLDSDANTQTNRTNLFTLTTNQVKDDLAAGYLDLFSAGANFKVAAGQSVNFAALFAGAGYQSNWAATVDWDANDAVSEEIVALNSQTGNLFVNIDFTTYDTNNFFDTQLKKDLLQYAATSVANRFGDTLTAITPDANNTWDQVFFAPNTGLTTNVANASLLQNEIVFYAGGRDLAGSTLGVGGPGGYGAVGFPPFFDTVEARGQAGALGANADKTDFSLWGGSIAFDTNSSWYYGIDNDEQAGESDFLSVALHEMVHGFGFGTSETWDNLSVNSLFTGTQTTNLYGSSPPVQPSHFDFGVTDPSTGQEAAMDPNITTGTRKVMTPLDFAVLDDMGWDLLSEPALLDDGSVTNSHIYTLPGMYTVTLEMLDTQSNLVTYTVLLQVIDVLQVATLTPNGAGSNADAPGYTAPNFSAFKQRSILQSVVITFNRAATGLTAADMQLKHIDSNGVTSTPTLTDNMISTSDNITYTLNLQSLTLTDGVYELLISDSVIDALTQANMDGDQDDISGGLFTSTRFHQLGGDFNGDAQFDLSDLPALAHYWKGHTVNPPAYLDLNSDNTVNHLDLANFTTWMSRLNLQVVEQIQAPPQQAGNLALALAAYQNGQASLTVVPASQVANGDAVAYEDLIGQWIA